tara:strand:- start:7 stop:258 length:252 start_codon:yes stop_codon:yes gene_type:complete
MLNTRKTKSNSIEIINKKKIYNLYENYNISPKVVKTSPININMKKSLSLDHFWPNTPPTNSPNETFLMSFKQFLNKKLKQFKL